MTKFLFLKYLLFKLGQKLQAVHKSLIAFKKFIKVHSHDVAIVVWFCSAFCFFAFGICIMVEDINSRGFYMPVSELSNSSTYLLGLAVSLFGVFIFVSPWVYWALCDFKDWLNEQRANYQKWKETTKL